MASKAQIINYISENYETDDGMPVSMSKLDSYKKAELESFLKENNDLESVEDWIKETK